MTSKVCKGFRLIETEPYLPPSRSQVSYIRSVNDPRTLNNGFYESLGQSLIHLRYIKFLLLISFWRYYLFDGLKSHLYTTTNKRNVRV